METQPDFESAMEAEPTQPELQPPQQQHGVAHKRLEQQKAGVKAVTDIMLDNINKILQKDEKLEDLSYKAEVLEEETKSFGSQTKKLNRKYWWKNCKMLAILIGIGLVIIVVIVVWAVTKKP